MSQREGPEGVKFAAAVMDFRAALRARVMTVNEGDPLPPDLAIVMQSLAFWSADQGQQWGKGIWDSKDFTPSAAEYSIVLASRYKCNIYVAEILNRVVGTVHTVHWSAEQSGRFFPYRANEWGDISRNIPHYPVVNGEKRKLGDIWALGDHMGIYLGTYAGVGIYISARDDGDGVFALDKVQHEHGIQIKFVKPGGTYRRYVP
jgi:hypothetical protein